MQELATIWASSTSYVVNQLVLQDEKLYRCAVAHTSGGTFIADLQAAYWVEISASAVSGINYVTNPNAEVDTSGWATYAESDAVTFQDAGDTVTLNSHGLSNGTAISFTSITSTTGISINTLYYVVNAATNTFQVATSVGGSALALTTNGSGTLVRSIPKLGTGGSPAVTFTRNTSSPLRGDADFRAAKDAANRMGQGVSYDFTIDDADLAKVLTLTFDYELITATGTYANADLVIYLIQDPTGTPVVIQPAGYRVLSAASALPQRQIATFQTSSSVKSYRLCVHVASVSATAYTLAIDNVSVGPQVVQYGAPVTDWQSYTPTVTVGSGTITNFSVTGKWSRHGDTLKITGDITFSGTPSAFSEIFVSYPAGLSVDTTKLQVGGSGGPIIGLSSALDSGTALYSGVANYAGTTVLLKPNAINTHVGTVGVFEPAYAQNFPITFGAADRITWQAEVPILGWSSTVQMSNDTDTRVVAAKIYQSSAQALSAGAITKATNMVAEFDSHGAWNSGTARYVAPVAGYYRVSAVASILTGATTERVAAYIYKNGSNSIFAAATGNAVGSAAVTPSGILSLNAGDYIELYVSLEGASRNTNPTAAGFYYAIERLTGPSAIAASETVAAAYTTVAGTVITAGVITKVPFATKDYDTHGSFVTDTFTAPVSGLYDCFFKWSSATMTLGTAQANSAYIYKNNSTIVALADVIGSGGSAVPSVAVRYVVRLLAGETIDFRARSSTNTSLQTSAGYNWFNITRVGNY